MTKSSPGRAERRLKKKTDGQAGAVERVLNWAHAPSPYSAGIGRVPSPIVPKENGMTNLQVLALLVSINGFNPRVTQWGHHEGPFGLTRIEAFLLMETSSYFQGLIDGAGVASESATNMLQPLCEYWAKRWEALEPPLAAVEAAAATPAEAVAE